MFKRALLGSALFVCLTGSAFLWADCGTWPAQRWVSGVTAVDGDTLHTGTGERIRLIGVNTPERGRKGRPVQPLAEQAHAHLRLMLGAAEKFAVQDGVEPRDRYGRTLAYVRSEEGADLSAGQIRAGLGFHVVVGGNNANAACYHALENLARDRRLGVWAHPEYRPVRAADFKELHAGFRRISGRVQHVGVTRGAYWLELDGPLVVRLARHAGSGDVSPARLSGRHLEISGWVIDRRRGGRTLTPGYKRFLLRADHPLPLRCDPEGK